MFDEYWSTFTAVEHVGEDVVEWCLDNLGMAWYWDSTEEYVFIHIKYQHERDKFDAKFYPKFDYEIRCRVPYSTIEEEPHVIEADNEESIFSEPAEYLGCPRYVSDSDDDTIVYSTEGSWYCFIPDIYNPQEVIFGFENKEDMISFYKRWRHRYIFDDEDSLNLQRKVFNNAYGMIEYCKKHGLAYELEEFGEVAVYFLDRNEYVQFILVWHDAIHEEED